MGFFKRLFHIKRKKESQIYVPEFSATPYAATSLARRSQEHHRLTVDEERRHTRSRSRSNTRVERSPATSRTPSLCTSDAPTTMPDHNSDVRSFQSSTNGRTTPSSLSVNMLPQSRDSYRVKVHGRIRHSSTEFPFANPPIHTARSRSVTPSTPDSSHLSPAERATMSPGDTNRILKMREDPSVTNLMNVLDTFGQARPDMFINTPVAPRRAPTLRTLLGSMKKPNRQDSHDTREEGDISWAERYLEERLGAEGSAQEDTNPHLKVAQQDPDRSFATANTSCTSEANDPALSSMVVERGTLNEKSMISEANQSSQSIGLGVPAEVTLVRSPSKRASQVFKFLLDPKDRPSSPEPPLPRASLATSMATPSLSYTPSMGYDSPCPVPSTSSIPGFKPLPTVPPFMSNDERPSLARVQTVSGPRQPHVQRARGGSLPLLSIDQHDNDAYDGIEDEEEQDPYLQTPSRPPKRPQSQRTPYPQVVSNSAHPQVQETRRRSHTLTRLDRLQYTAAAPPPMPIPAVYQPSPEASLGSRDFMAEFRKRAASTVGSIVSLSKSKRYSERFVAIEWEEPKA